VAGGGFRSYGERRHFRRSFERTGRALTQNQLQELLESDQIRAIVEGAEERGYIDPAAIVAFAVEQELNEQDLEELTRELERLGLEIGQAGATQPGAAGAPVAAKVTEEAEDKEEKEEEAPVPTVAISGSADSLQLFLADVGRHKLLTAADEVMLAKRIERGDVTAKRHICLLYNLTLPTTPYV
jgi:RNA polymerase primary sigma factor